MNSYLKYNVTVVIRSPHIQNLLSTMLLCASIHLENSQFKGDAGHVSQVHANSVAVLMSLLFFGISVSIRDECQSRILSRRVTCSNMLRTVPSIPTPMNPKMTTMMFCIQHIVPTKSSTTNKETYSFTHSLLLFFFLLRNDFRTITENI